MSAPSLYHLSADLAALEALLADANEQGETVNDTSVVAGWIAELEGTLADRLARLARWRLTELALAAAGKAEAKRLQERAVSRQNAVERLEAGIAEVMTRMGVKKVDTDVSTFSMAKAGGKDPVVVDDGVDLATLPADCVKTTFSPIKDAIRAHLEAGDVVAGCHIQERGLALRVK